MSEQTQTEENSRAGAFARVRSALLHRPESSESRRRGPIGRAFDFYIRPF